MSYKPYEQILICQVVKNLSGESLSSSSKRLVSFTSLVHQVDTPMDHLAPDLWISAAEHLQQNPLINNLLTFTIKDFRDGCKNININIHSHGWLTNFCFWFNRKKFVTLIVYDLWIFTSAELMEK